jgi:hypothetical protein
MIVHIFKIKKSIVITEKPTRISGIIAISIVSILFLYAGLATIQQLQQPNASSTAAAAAAVLFVFCG